MNPDNYSLDKRMFKKYGIIALCVGLLIGIVDFVLLLIGCDWIPFSLIDNDAVRSSFESFISNIFIMGVAFLSMFSLFLIMIAVLFLTSCKGYGSLAKYMDNDDKMSDENN